MNTTNKSSVQKKTKNNIPLRVNIFNNNHFLIFYFRKKKQSFSKILFNVVESKYKKKKILMNFQNRDSNYGIIITTFLQVMELFHYTAGIVITFTIYWPIHSTALFYCKIH